MQYPALGIDVSQLTLVVLLMLADGSCQQGPFSNDSKGFAQLKRWLRRQVDSPLYVCLEATGRYSDAIAHDLYGEPWVAQVSVLNPSRIHAYARSHMRRNKNDKADAWLLAHFAVTQNPAGWRPPSPQQQTLQELMRHRDNLLDARQQVRNRLSAGVRHEPVQRQVQEQEE
jgi:transposase